MIHKYTKEQKMSHAFIKTIEDIYNEWIAFVESLRSNPLFAQPGWQTHDKRKDLADKSMMYRSRMMESLSLGTIPFHLKCICDEFIQQITVDSGLISGLIISCHISTIFYMKQQSNDPTRRNKYLIEGSKIRFRIFQSKIQAAIELNSKVSDEKAKVNTSKKIIENQNALNEQSFDVTISKPNQFQMPNVCSICMDIICKKKMTTSCDHAFHITCIGKWANDHNTCPMCRTLL